jgi:hypothetical protein
MLFMPFIWLSVFAAAAQAALVCLIGNRAVLAVVNALLVVGAIVLVERLNRIKIKKLIPGGCPKGCGLAGIPRGDNRGRCSRGTK